MSCGKVPCGMTTAGICGNPTCMMFPRMLPMLPQPVPQFWPPGPQPMQMGCICPPGSEATCKGTLCPRRGPTGL